MPLLEFECEACGVRFEELVASGSSVDRCPECGAGELRRLYSQVSPARRIGLSGAAARESDARRSEREARRQERFAQQRKALGRE